MTAVGEAFFYHLTRSTVEDTLRLLLSKCRAQGWRVAVRGTDPARMDRLDQQLWLGDGFLPHGLAGGPHDADQPILLTTTPAAANTPDCLMSVDGAEVSAEEVGAAARTCILFDGMDGDALERARNQWRALTGAGCRAVYWSQEDGDWAKKAESG